MKTKRVAAMGILVAIMAAMAAGCSNGGGSDSAKTEITIY